jgi:hypothetical protein
MRPDAGSALSWRLVRREWGRLWRTEWRKSKSVNNGEGLIYVGDFRREKLIRAHLIKQLLAALVRMAGLPRFILMLLIVRRQHGSRRESAVTASNSRVCHIRQPGIMATTL